MTAWQIEELMHQPDPLVLDGKDMYIQRKNIAKVEADGDKPEHYICEMRFISVAEYEMLKAMQNIMQGKNEV